MGGGGGGYLKDKVLILDKQQVLDQAHQILKKDHVRQAKIPFSLRICVFLLEFTLEARTSYVLLVIQRI